MGKTRTERSSHLVVDGSLIPWFYRNDENERDTARWVYVRNEGEKFWLRKLLCEHEWSSINRANARATPKYNLRRSRWPNSNCPIPTHPTYYQPYSRLVQACDGEIKRSNTKHFFYSVNFLLQVQLRLLRSQNCQEYSSEFTHDNSEY